MLITNYSSPKESQAANFAGKNTSTTGKLNALFRINVTSIEGMATILERIKRETRSINVTVSTTHPQLVFITYQPGVIDLQDIQQDLNQCDISATLVTC